MSSLQLLAELIELVSHSVLFALILIVSDFNKVLDIGKENIPFVEEVVLDN
jgi:hypothetical protein